MDKHGKDSVYFKAFIYLTFFFILAIISGPTLAETKVTGFASMVGGVVTTGNQYLADYPNTGVYDQDISFSPDTTIGVQLKTHLSTRYEFVTQLLSRGASDFDTSIDWAYLNYLYSSEISIQLGRKRLPLYYYSDFYEVGLAYHWIRPPSDNYTWQITNYNGVNVTYEPETGQIDTLFMLYFGREDDTDNSLLGFLSSNGDMIDESWKNIFGFVSEVSTETLEFRLTVMTSELDRDNNSSPLLSDVDQTFYGFSFNAHLESYVVLSEFNRYERPSNDIFVSTYMLSLAYKLKKLTPHITYSELKQTQNTAVGDEFHFTSSIGLRYDINSSTAFKLQFDKTTDEGINTPVIGDGELLSFGIDVVF